LSDVDAKLPSHSNDAILLGVLDAVERDASVTQRTVALELGIALGLANAYLKRCVRKGLIKVSQVPTRRYAYFLTPQGMTEKSRLTATYLANSFSFFRMARAEYGGLYVEALRRGQSRVALLGHGDLSEIANLVAREHPIEVVGVVAASRDAGELTASVSALGQIDAVIVTSTESPQEVCAAAVTAFGQVRVHVPALLRVRLSSAAELVTGNR
jgi:DNA-binding MarR family transcriptional regulator